MCKKKYIETGVILMDFLRRAWLFTKAKVGRTALLILTMTAVLVFVLAGLVINNSANKSIETAKKEAGATVTLSVNRENMMKRPDDSSSTSTDEKPTFEMTPVKESDAEKIADLSGVKSYSFTKQTSATKGDGIEPISTSDSSSSSNESSDAMMPGGGRGGMMEQQSGDFRVVGTNDLASSTDFSSGTNEITDGRALTADDEGTENVVIEENLASENDLKVGDTFKLEDDEAKAYTVKVVGIYKSSASVDTMAQQFSFMNVSNQIYSSLSFANTLAGTTGTLDSAVYNLSNPKNTDAFVEKAEKLVDTDTYSVTSNDAMYQQMLAPLNNVAKFSKNIVWLVAIAGAIILTLIMLLMVRERRGEIGILMSMGESRKKIIGQFFTEVLMITAVSVGLATAIGGPVGNVIGSQLLNSETTTTQTVSAQGGPGATNGNAPDGQMPGGNGGFGGGGPMSAAFGQNAETQAEINKLNVKLTGKQIAILGAIALGIAAVAILIASIGIVRLNPKAILTGA
jgi:putative ABC transport system permease protein